MLIDDGFIQIPTIAAASVSSPASGFAKMFFDASNSGKLSQKDSSGVVTDLTATGGGGGGVVVASTAPASPTTGQEWEDTNSGIKYTWSGNGWVELGPSNAATVSKTIGITVDGSGSALSTGVQGYIVAAFNGVITGWDLVANAAGSVVVDVWKTAGPTIPTVANKITSTTPPTLTAQQINGSNNVSLWGTSVSIGDVFAFNINSASTITKVTLTLKANQT